MPNFTHKPTRVEARQFTGGEENAKLLITWLKEVGVEATWHQSYSVDIPAGKFTMPEQLFVETKEYGLIIVEPTEWVAKRADNSIYKSSHADFEANFNAA